MRIRFERYSLIDRVFGLIEKQRPSDRLVLRILFFTVIASSIYLFLSINNSYLTSVPTSGGTLTEGIVGIPRFINPTLAITRADQDTVALVYSGLMKIDENGNLQPDIAESISLSEDGRTYSIKLRQDRNFHDGTPITAQDIIYTIELIKNPDLKSPFRGNWSDVTAEEVTSHELNITLTEPYTPFIENFTIGIMPKHVWNTLPIEQLPFSQYNTEPIGSGPFAIDTVHRDNSGLINGYTLKPAQNFGTQPNLSAIELKYFQNEDLLATAFENKEITSTVFLPTEKIAELDQQEVQIITQPLPRVFGIFLNQNRSPALRDKSARKALSVAIDRDRLIAEALGGYGVPTTKPILNDYRTIELEDTEENTNSTSSPTSAKDILIAGGWKQNDAGLWEKEIDDATEALRLTIRTNNTPLFDTTTTIIAENWRELGVKVQIEQYEQTGLVQSVIRTRDFQALLFGLDINRMQDLYPFWHSSQKDDPGLNIAQYTNVSVDTLLEKARTTEDGAEREKLLNEISDIIIDDTPAIFLFAPSVTYVVDKDIKITPMNTLGKPSDRFMNIANWHAKTEVVWPIFQNN